VIGLVLVQNEVKHGGHLGQAVIHAATVADQRLWASANSGSARITLSSRDR
jgi:hypothetical protein